MTGLVTKKYGFMPRVTILCHSKEKLNFYIYIYISLIERKNICIINREREREIK